MLADFLIIFARFSGLFLLSPFFSQLGLPRWSRFTLTFATALVLFPTLTGTFELTIQDPVYFALELIKQGALGYLIGFLFSLLFEAAAFAGQLVGTLAGFSATELIDPEANSRHPLFSRLFALTLFAFFLTLDFHHPLLRLLHESFDLLSADSLFEIASGSALLFKQALSYALYPLTTLLLLLFCFLTIARFFPAFQIFWTGFPLQLLLGLSALAFAVGFFPHILRSAFFTLLSLLKNLPS